MSLQMLLPYTRTAAPRILGFPGREWLPAPLPLGQRTEGFPCSPAVCHSLTCSLIQPMLIHCVTVWVAGVDKDSLCDQTAARIR